MEENLQAIIRKINNLLSVDKVLKVVFDDSTVFDEKNDKIRVYCPIHGEKVVRTLMFEVQHKSFKCSYTMCAGYQGGDLFTFYCLATKSSIKDAVHYWVKQLNITDKISDTLFENESDTKLIAPGSKSSPRTPFFTQHSSAKLTGALIRDSILTYLQREIDRSYRYERDFGLILFEIEYPVEDGKSLAHAVRDRFMAGIADVVSKSIRMADMWAHFGTDRLILILPETNIENTSAVANKIKIELNRFCNSHPDECPVPPEEMVEKINFGVTGIINAQHTKNYLTADELIKQAEQSLSKSN